MNQSIQLSLLPAGLLLIATGCHQPKSDPIKILKWVESADPIADANLAIAKGDFRLKGINGLGLMIPGTDLPQYEEATKTKNVISIEGTSDVVYGEEHLRLIDLAFKYAEAYNRQVLSASNKPHTISK
jgi:hypothetical protein